MYSLNDPEITEHCISVCNSLLRGEMAAVDTYAQVLATHSREASPAVAELRRIRAEHTRAVSLLSENVREMGGEPDGDSGAWGLFVSAVQGTANLLGKNSARESLQKGEEFGRKEYQEALLDPEVMEPCKRVIRDELLPKVIEHIACLEKLEYAG